MIRLAHPLFTRADWEGLWPILASGNLVQGHQVASFEAACAQRLGVGRMVAVSSGTAALHLALWAATSSRTGEVIVPSLGWPSAANTSELLGNTLRVVDIGADTLNLDVGQLAGAVSQQTRAVVPIHLFGLAMPAAAVRAAVGDVPVIEDAACAFGATDANGVLAGTWGAFSAFSLHARKGLTAGEGGLLWARDDETLARLARLRDHGLERGPAGASCVEPGLNYRLTEVGAALGLAQLHRFDEALALRRRLAARYLAALGGLSAVRLPQGLNQPGHSYQSFVVALADGEDRAGLMARLREQGVESGPGTHALHLQPYYAQRYALKPDDLPVARWAHEKLLALPLHEQMVEDDVDRVVSALEVATRHPRNPPPVQP